MLPARHRLRRSRDFTSVVRRGRRAGRGALVVHYLARLTDDQLGPKVGLVVGKSVGKAVTRHRVSRRLRHLLGERLDQLDPHGAVVVRALPASASATSRQLAADLDAALARVLSGGARHGADERTGARVI